MRRFYFTILLCIMFAVANAQFIFKINGGGLESPSYMLGTVHLLSGELLDSVPEFLEAEAQCRQMYVEYDITDEQHLANLHNQGNEIATLPDDKTIFDVLGEEKTHLLQDNFQQYLHINLLDSAAKTFWNYQPFFFTTLLSAPIMYEVMKKFPGVGKGVLDSTCSARAKARGWYVGELDQLKKEEERAKLKMSLNQSIDEQVDSLMALINNYEERKQNMMKEFENLQKLVDCWTASDYELFESIMQPEVEATPQIFGNRNTSWIPIMIEAMKEAPTLFVFGAGHFVGPQGIINLLRESGYEVERLK